MGGGGGSGKFKGTKGGKADKQRRGTPRNNQAQNRQTDNIASRLRLTPDEQRELHDLIHGQNMGYQEILELAKEWFGRDR